MTTTVSFITIILLIIIAYDLWTIITHGYQTTISWTMYTWAKDYPIIPFALGVVFGHLFWSIN